MDKHVNQSNIILPIEGKEEHLHRNIFFSRPYTAYYINLRAGNCSSRKIKISYSGSNLLKKKNKDVKLILFQRYLGRRLFLLHSWQAPHHPPPLSIPTVPQGSPGTLSGGTAL